MIFEKNIVENQRKKKIILKLYFKRLNEAKSKIKKAVAAIVVEDQLFERHN